MNVKNEKIAGTIAIIATALLLTFGDAAVDALFRMMGF